METISVLFQRANGTSFSVDFDTEKDAEMFLENLKKVPTPSDNKTRLGIYQLTQLEEIITTVNQNRGMDYDAANFYARMYFFCEYPTLGHCFI